MNISFPVNTKHVYNVYTTSAQRLLTLVQHCINVLQMYCVCWIDDFYNCFLELDVSDDTNVALGRHASQSSTEDKATASAATDGLKGRWTKLRSIL